MINDFSEFLQKNPYAVVLFAVIGVISAIIGVITGWRQFYTTMRNKIAIPVWVIFVSLLIFFTAFLGLSLSKDKFDDIPKELEPVIGKDFGHEAVNIDGKSFERCKFFQTQLVFSGKDLFSLQECELNGTNFLFASNASVTVEAMTRIYKDPAFRPQIDSIIQDIRLGNLQYMPKPTNVE